MSVPQMTRALTLEHRVLTPDGAGGSSAMWHPLGVVWAAIQPGTGRETASLSRSTYRITLRAAPTGSPQRPAPGQRFRQGTRVFSIDAVTDADPRGLHLTCFATESVAT